MLVALADDLVEVDLDWQNKWVLITSTPTDPSKSARRHFVRVTDPRFRAIDLEITICVKPGHIPSEVRDRVLRRLTGDGVRPGYFNADTFTFGQPLYRLTLEGIIGAVPGALGVREILVSARAVHDRRDLETIYTVPDNEILRLANDPHTPERGSIRVYTEGGV